MSAPEATGARRSLPARFIEYQRERFPFLRDRR